MANRVGTLCEEAWGKVSRRRLKHDRAFRLALLAGPVFWLGLSFLVPVVFDPKKLIEAWWPFLLFAAVFPVLEEWLFRGLLQPLLLQWGGGRAGVLGFSLANLITTGLFVSAHFFYHPPVWAALVFFPSLVFGWFRDRYQHIFPAILLHCFYNTGYFVLFRSG